MAIALQQTQYLTYEEYLAEGEVNLRYDILDGARQFMTNPARLHQDVALNIGEMLRRYQRRARNGKTLMAPCDVLMRVSPLRTRQQDVLYISHERLAQCKEETDPAPLLAAPELVVETLSPRESKRSVGEKLADYCAVGVKECWLVNTEERSVEVLRLTKEGVESVGTHNLVQGFQSLAFADLSVSASEVFALD